MKIGRIIENVKTIFALGNFLFDFFLSLNLERAVQIIGYSEEGGKKKADGMDQS